LFSHLSAKGAITFLDKVAIQTEASAVRWVSATTIKNAYNFELKLTFAAYNILVAFCWKLC